MTCRDARLFARLKAHAAIIRPQLLRRFGLEPADASPEPCPACDASGTVWRLHPNPPREAVPAQMNENVEATIEISRRLGAAVVPSSSVGDESERVANTTACNIPGV